MKTPMLFIYFAFSCSLTSCSQSGTIKNSGDRKVGDGCEGCEAIYESPVPFAQLTAVATLPDFKEAGPKIEISGIIYKSDGRTPAPGVVLYVYHTDQQGIYPGRQTETGWGKRHGSIRGWIKTDEHGVYRFYTLVPASYPDGKNPKHIHPVIKEADKSEYWIDEFLFDGDPYLTAEEKNKANPRGGNGILKPQLKNGMLRATRHIILGLNVPGYPREKKTAIGSGLQVGENCPAFDPFHLSGADKGKTTCPMCKYGYGRGIMVWFNHANLDVLKPLATRLEKEMNNRGEKNLRVFLIYMNPFYDQNDSTGLEILKRKIKKWCAEQHLEKVAMLWVPSPIDAESCGLFRINPKANNTVFVYKKRTVAAKWVNIDYNDVAVNEILDKIDTPSK